MPAKRLTIQQRKEIFHALVATQDTIHNVRKSYEMVTEQFRRLYPQRSNRVEPILKANPSLVHEIS